MKTHFDRARKNVDDEFYTHYEDIEKELSNYNFQNKSIFLPCDGEQSAFWPYFYENAEKLQYKTVSRCDYFGNVAEYDRKNLKQFKLSSGDFRNPELDNFWETADIIVTNPPFSLIREFLGKILALEKDYIIVSPLTTIGYAPMAKALVDEKRLFWGMNDIKYFTKPDGTEVRFGNVGWITSFQVCENKPFIPLTATYNPESYPKYDNYDAIDVSKVKDMPMDYDGVMGVPISFYPKFNPKQFILIGTTRYHDGEKKNVGYVNGKEKFARLLIKRI